MNACEDLQRAIVTAWAAGAGVGISVYFNVADKDASIPYAVFFINSDFERLWGGRVQPVIVQFNIYTDAASSESANDFAETVKAKFDNVTLTLPGGNTMMEQMEIESENIFKDEDKHWQATLLFAAKLR